MRLYFIVLAVHFQCDPCITSSVFSCYIPTKASWQLKRIHRVTLNLSLYFKNDHWCPFYLKGDFFTILFLLKREALATNSAKSTWVVSEVRTHHCLGLSYQRGKKKSLILVLSIDTLLILIPFSTLFFFIFFFFFFCLMSCFLFFSRTNWNHIETKIFLRSLCIKTII